MSDLSLLATDLAKAQAHQKPSVSNPVAVHSSPLTDKIPEQRQQPDQRQSKVSPWFQPYPELSPQPEFSNPPSIMGPRSGSQLYQQRIAALRAGKLYTRLPGDSFYASWSRATRKPSYMQWRRLLAQEARAVARGQGNNRLAILLGDSLSLWFPSDRLSQNHLWLNQSISGETTQDILRRLPDFARTRPSVIYLMAGINDLKQGVPEERILHNLQQIMRHLRRVHPHSQIVVQSILPTRSVMFSSQQIEFLNQRLAAIAQQEGTMFLDLYSQMADEAGSLRADLTTDGLHLSSGGYEVWSWVLQQAELQIASTLLRRF